MPIEFIITALIVVLIPGTGVIYTLSTCLTSGMRAAMFAIIGCTLSIVPHLLASIFGLAAILHQSATLFQIMKYAGALYLLYLAYGMWRSNMSIDIQAGKIQRPPYQIMRDGILLNLLNPKLTLFFFAFLPPSVPSNALHPVREMSTLGLTFMAMTFVVYVIYASLAHVLRHKIINSENSMRFL